MREKEFEILYNSIAKSENLIQNARSILYTAVSAIWMFVLTQGAGNPFYYLVPLIIILPMYHLSSIYVKGIFRIAAYLIVFYERDSDIQWQTRLLGFRKTVKDNFRARYINYDSIPYLGISLICLAPYFYNLAEIGFTFSYEYIFKFMLGIAIVILIVLITRKQKATFNMVEYYIKEWETIRDAEEHKPQICENEQES